MSMKDAEREWLRRVCRQTITSEKEKKVERARQETHSSEEVIVSRKGNGFGDVAGMDELKGFITDNFINVLRNPKCAKAYGICPPSMLFYGPAGCGKTFFAEKMAEEVGINFMKIVPDDLACTWVHGTQQKIGEVFRKAEKQAPTLLFFDEFDAMVPRRSGEEANQHYDSEVNEFLCMLNNTSDRGIYVVAATNHPERIDKAVLRTGRIDEIIYIDMPDKQARKSLFSLALSRLPSDKSIDIDRLADLTEGYNCSDISYIVKTAARKMFNDSIKDKSGEYRLINQTLLEMSITGRRPSVSGKDLREYERVRSELLPKDSAHGHAAIGFR